MKDIFHTLIDEAQFTREILATGVNRIGKANYAQKGIYFDAFTGLSTGLERIGKLCLILEYYISNNGSFPDDNYVRNNFGHDLMKIYCQSKLFVDEHKIKFNYQDKIDDPIQIEILRILSSFAKGDRYSNINFLVKSRHQSDPTKDWHEKVDKKLFETRVTKRKKQKIVFHANKINELFGHVVSVRFQGESGEEINDLAKSSFMTGMTNSIAKYRRLYVLQIIRYWVELIRNLQYPAQDLGRKEIPWFTEIFAIFFNEDSFFLRRKTFVKD